MCVTSTPTSSFSPLFFGAPAATGPSTGSETDGPSRTANVSPYCCCHFREEGGWEGAAELSPCSVCTLY